MKTFTHITPPVELVDLKSTTNPIKGRFYTTPEGNVYPSITTVLGAKEKPWLEDWTKMLGPQKAAKETKRCADRGSATHSMIEKYLQNQEDVTKGHVIEHVKMFNQFRFLLNRIDNIYAQEVALYSDTLRMAGRVDCIGEYNGVLSIIDFKTANNNKDAQMIEDYFLQCTAYAIMWHERTGIPISDITVLISVEKGLVPLVFQEKIDKYVKPLLQRRHQYELKGKKHE